MIGDTIERDFHEKVSAQIRLHPDGSNRFRVFTPFLFEDETYLLSGARRKIISKALSMFEVEDRNGELVLHVSDGRYGDALYSFIQALLKIAYVESGFADAD